jgi:serine/threonine-protein kinase
MAGLEPGRIVERYRVEEILGQGGTAVVYRVRHLHLGTDHALKVLTSHAGQATPRLLLEGRVQAGLRHPHVVAVTDVLHVDGAPGLLMEYVPPPSLARWLDTHRPSLEEAEALFRGIVAGVAHAHGHGLVHRDLKPSNVLLAPVDGRLLPKVADFGLAKLLDEGDVSQTRTGFTMGTPQFMAPEQFRDAKNVDRRADLFSLGCILHQLVSGAVPFSGNDLITLYDAMMARRWQPLPASLPPRVRAAIEGCLAPDRGARIPDCASLLAVLSGEQASPTLAPAGGMPAFQEPDLLVLVPVPSSAPLPVAIGGAVPDSTVVSAAPRVLPRAPLPTPPADPTLLPTERAELPGERRGLVAAVAAVALVVLAIAIGLAWPEGPVEADRVSVAPASPPPAEAAPAGEVVVPPAAPPTPSTAAPTRPAVARSSPTPVAAPVVAPEAAVPTPVVPAEKAENARVSLTGASSAWVQSPTGTRISLPGGVPPGAWTAWVDFGDGPVVGATLTVDSSEPFTLKCNAGFQQCSVAR